ncbi:MAG: AraC family transcriptional regulator [Verrucomicrobiota bacterium]
MQKKINHQLLRVLAFIPPLQLEGVTLKLQHMHLGQWSYDSGHNVGIHRHDEAQIEYILSGEFSFQGNGLQLRFRAGDGNLIPPDLLHSWRCVKSGQMLGIHISVEGKQKEEFLQLWKKNNSQGMKRVHSKELERLMVELLKMASLREIWGVERLANMVYNWLAAFFASSLSLDSWQPVGRLTDNRDEYSWLICKRAMDFIQLNSTNPIQLNDVARHVGISSRHLNRLFCKHYQGSIKQRLVRIRLELACGLLAEGRPIKDVAYSCGFQSASYFTSCFKKTYGYPPRKT